jgi:hypothetical protein
LEFRTESVAQRNSLAQLLERMALRSLKLRLAVISRELTKRGFNSEGLFRVGGSGKDVADLKQDCEHGCFGMYIGRAKKSPLQAKDEHALCGLFKSLLRDMAVPLMEFSLYSEWLGLIALQSDQQRIEASRALAEKMQPGRHALLIFLFEFLHRVSLNSEQTKMTADNLSIVFTPNILRREKENMESIQGDLKQALFAVSFLITNAPLVWPRAESMAAWQTMAAKKQAQPKLVVPVGQTDELKEYMEQYNLDPTGKILQACASLFIKDHQMLIAGLSSYSRAEAVAFLSEKVPLTEALVAPLLDHLASLASSVGEVP